MDDRLARDLIEANLRLTNQIIELARLLAIDAPRSEPVQESTYEAGVVSHEELFKFDPADDWEDIPSEPEPVRAIEVTRRGEDPLPTRHLVAVPASPDPEPSLPPYIPEEEEDMRYSVAMGLRDATDLQDLLKRYELPSHEIQFIPPEQQ